MYEICHVAERRYRTGTYAGTMLLFRGEGLHESPDLGWSKHVAGGVRTIEVEGTHVNQRDLMFEPAVATVAQHVRDALAEPPSAVAV